MIEMQTHGPKQSKTISLLAVCLGFFIVIMDVTIVNVALPTIAKSLGGGIAWLQWVVDGYTLTFAVFLLSAGHLSDRIGAKKVFLWGLSLFALSSIGCGFAFNFWQLTSFRLIQGIAAALLVPTSLALINLSYTNKHERAKAIGVWAGMGGIAAAVGPVFGAVLTTYWGWKAIFFVNVPIVFVAVFLTIKYVSPRQVFNGDKNDFDIIGQVTAMISIAALAFSLIEGGKFGWSSQLVLTGFGIFIIAFMIFLFVEHRNKSPMFPLEFFKSKNFSTSIMVGMILNIGIYGELFVLSLYFQQIRGYSVLLTGFAFLPLLAVTAITSYYGGKVVSAIGIRLPMIIGLAVGAAGFFALVITGEHTPIYFALTFPLAAMGFGIAFTMPAATYAIINSVAENRAGIASGALNASRQTGSLVGVAIFGTIVNLSGNFIKGFHYTLLIGGIMYLCGCLATILNVKEKTKIEIIQ